ncbi:MAG: VCBS repeat-containing protein [Myxococcaceae bacterium]
MKLRVSLVVAALLALAGCDATITAPPKPPPPVDDCADLAPMTAVAVPDTIRVNGASSVSASGGTGRYTFAVTSSPAVGTISGSRYVAGLELGTDTITASDDCGNFATVSIQVTAAFEVLPERATVPPTSSFTIQVKGARGAPIFTPQGGTLASGGTLTSAGVYTAGMGAGTDVVLVRDSLTGDQAAVVINVSPNAQFRAAAARLAVPTGSFVPLEVLDGSGVVTWSITSSPAVGSIEVRDGVAVYVPGAAGGGEVVELEARDQFLPLTAQVKVRVLIELQRPGLVPQGRRTDVATLVTGDFDGDGIDDVALGVPESDRHRPQGGAVFIFKGDAAGFPAEPTWIIDGQSDTAQFGAVMAAGDLDGDGRADLAISAPGDDLTVMDSGAVYLYGIGPNGPRQLRPPLTGLGRGNFGAALAIADVDGDGDQDLVVGSPGADLAPGGAFTARGVIDLFLLQKDQPIPDLGSVRLSGWDLDPDAGVRRFSNLRMGRAIVASDLNGDQVTDLAFLGSVNNSIQLDGGNLARNVIAAQVHLGRNAAKHFEDTPDFFVLPANTADGDEGTWRLGFIPASGGRPPLLVTAADRADSPDLRANDAGVQSGSNSGGALLFDLTSMQSPGTPPTVPPQLGRLTAWARVYADTANVQSSRSFAVLDGDGDGQPELALGAPYASTTDAGVTLANAGRLEFFSLSRLSAGAVVNRPDFSLFGRGRTDVMGTAVAPWRSSVVVFNSRASTSLGDFTGRLDVFGAGSPDPWAWPVTSAATESALASTQLGVGIDLAPTGAGLAAVVGAPGWNGAAADLSGSEIGAGQAIGWVVNGYLQPRVLAEGANTTYVTDAGTRAFGGRTVGADVAVTDFDGDGKLDVAIAMPNFSPPLKLADGGVNSTEYALNRPECAPSAAQTPGGVLVQLGQADGTFKEGFRVWAPRDITGCVVPDGGSVSICQRTQLSRNGLVGQFDFDGDGRRDLGVVRSNGFDVFAGRPPDDAQLNKPSMACDPLFTLPFIAQTTSMPAALGDLDGDGCDEVGLRYSDNANRQGVVIAFGFDPGGARCGGHTQPAWVRISGDTETGVPTMRLGVSMTRARQLLQSGVDSVAITADLYPFQGVTQPTVLLVPTAQIAAKRPSSGERLVSILGDGLVAVPVVPTQRALGFGRVVMGDVDVDADGKRDLVVSATGANINGDGTGAVLVFKGGTVVSGPNRPALVIVADDRERSAFGQDLALSAAAGSVPAAIGIGAPLSYRHGTANGTAFVLPLDF